MLTNVYIDGFNLFFGAIKGTGYKWLNPYALSCDLLRGHQIQRVKYFTARVDDRPDDLEQSQRQDVYLRVLRTVPQVEIYEGQFKTRTKRVRLARPRSDGSEYDDALVTEEKGTDVALASHLVWDSCHRGGLEAALVISNDSDLQTPIDMAIQVGLQVIIVNPHRHVRQSNHLFGSDTRNLRKAHLEKAQFPAQVLDAEGRRITRPVEWAP